MAANAHRPPSAGGRRGGNPPGRSGNSGRRRPRGRKEWLKFTGIAFLALCVLGLLTGVFVYNAVGIPDPNKDFQAQTTQVYYANGQSKLGQFATQNRQSIPLSEVPKHVQDAVVAAEDRTFWTNNGIDLKGILRAFLSNAEGNATQGGSTITQQYVKILYLSSQRTITRKIKEAVVALKLQQQQSKQQILEGYLNTIYFGRGAYGIQAAAQAYFNVDAKNLTVAQGAVLASVLNAPADFDPANGAAAKRRLLERYRYVLNGMATMGNLDPTRAARLEQRLPVLPKPKSGNVFGGQRGFMLSMVRSELHGLGFSDDEIDGGGLKIVTTFSRKDMNAMRDGINQYRPSGLKGLHVASATVDVHTGALRAIYGGQDYVQSQLNWALAGAQPGSTFKLFALAAGIKQGFSLRSTFDGNSPYKFPDGSEIRNEGPGLGNSYGSAISLITATAQSVNTAFADLTQSMRNGPQAIKDMARKMGIDVKKYQVDANSGIALGQTRIGLVDMVNAYATVANAGVEHPWFVVQKVSRISDGKVLYRAHPKTSTVLPADIAADVSYALQQVVSQGTGTAAQAISPYHAAGKTGTATKKTATGERVSSAWFIGYTPELATAVMYCRGTGNEPLDGWLPAPYSYFGAGYPAHTWAAIMRAEMQGLPVTSFPPPVFVTGTPPSSGHLPPPPPPPPSAQPTQQPKATHTAQPKPTPKPQPKPTPTPTPTQPTPTPSPTLPLPTFSATARGGPHHHGPK